MAEDHNTEHHHHHHHHHHYNDGRSSSHTNSWGGGLKLRDKQAYYGLMFIIVVVLAFGAFKLVKMFANELHEMPNGDPTQELKVDELGIRKVDEADALFLGDSLARQYNIDSLRRTVKGEEHNVYRPPRKNDNELIDGREWKDIWSNLQHWFKANGGDPEFIIGLVLFLLGILGLVAFGIYKHKHRND